MRRIERKEDYFGLTAGFNKAVSDISPYCFISDINSVGRELHFANKKVKYENAYLIDKALKSALDGGKYDEQKVLIIQEEKLKQKCVFYMNYESRSVAIGSHTKEGIYILDFINSTLVNTFSNAVNEAYCETKIQISDLYEKVKELEINPQTEGYKKFVKDEYFLFLKNAISLPLIVVRATYILNCSNYSYIKDFIIDNLCIVGESTSCKIKSKIDYYEKELNRNKVLFDRNQLFREMEGHLRGYSYELAGEKWKEGIGPIEAYPLINYAKLLFDNNSEFNWEMNFPLLNTSQIKEDLLLGFDKFKPFIGDDDVKSYLEIKRKLSKAQIFFFKKDLSNFVATLQKFMEAYLSAIGADKKINNKGNEKKLNTIREKVNNAICNNNDAESINSTILKLFDISFGQNSELMSINKDFEFLNYIRNDFQHDDIGLSINDLNTKLGYLMDEELGAEEHTGLFQKYLTWFCMPEVNIFDQINIRIIQILKKPHLLYQDE